VAALLKYIDTQYRELWYT